MNATSSTKNKTSFHKSERERLVNYYRQSPFFGRPEAKIIYEKMKMAIPSLIQVSVCGRFLSVVAFKKDEDKAAQILAGSFSANVKSRTCAFTGFITLTATV